MRIVKFDCEEAAGSVLDASRSTNASINLLKEVPAMPTITTPDGVKIFYKDWGSGQPIIFSHGWPLSADDWDAQMMFFLHHGYRVIAHDRRGHGRSEQVGTGNDMDHWVADLAALTEHLGVRDAIHIGHSTGGGEVARYVARHQERVAKAVLVASLTPNMVKTDTNPGGQPREWFDAVKSGVLGNRSEFYRAVPEGPFYGFNRPGAKPSEAVIANWWRQGMAGSAQAHYETVSSWLEDYTDDLKKITVPVMVMHGEDDQIVPFASSVPRAVDLLANGVLKTYSGFPHGMLTTHADVLNPDLLEFIRS
ncbi:pimeloyl-ACP methyl ester carboxylesterase [Paraburkholderia sp. JPY162]|uniref:Pimeloyl-ACP methyl ester carboxylesterase n=2 Tax=Paraburkholderia youngii TaxID=2782701 RepID=A0A7W8L9J5_9BURK|nr:pimeloyl-ACP methyl ester carboxylesterase [Paraburkholderia youngii]